VLLLRKSRIFTIVLCAVITILALNIELHNVKASVLKKQERDLAILVDLVDERLYLIDKENNLILKNYRIASGKRDSPSPIGTWTVVSMGKWSGGFGTRWIGLNVPWGKYGIHGTNNPHSIGSEASHGCIRMFNRDVEELYEYVCNGMTVVICACPYGAFEKGLVTLKPGDRGSAIYEVQRQMKQKGYYPGSLDGIYGEGMKKYVIKFRVDNKLKLSHDIDREFYERLGVIFME